MRQVQPLSRPCCLAAGASLALLTACPAQTATFQRATPVPTQSVWHYDARRGETMILETGAPRRHWRWDGTECRELLGVTHGDSLRALAHDPIAGTLYATSTTALGIFDGARWLYAPLPAAGSPVRIAFDSARGCLVGLSADGLTVLEWSAGAWRQVPLASPATGLLAFDPQLGACLRLAPATTSQATARLHLWSWNGSTWQLRDNAGPLLDALLAVSVDPATGTLFVEIDKQGVRELWQRQGSMWQQLPDPPDGVTGDATLCWDGGGLLRIGNTNTQPRRLWRWFQGTWHQLAGQPPAAATGFALAASHGRREILRFGGSFVPTSNLLTAETWRFTTHWEQLDPALSPPARHGAGLAWSATDQVFVLFGGTGPTGFLQDTWTWDGTNWALQSTSGGPSQNSTVRMATDPQAGVLLIQDPGLHWRWQAGSWQALGNLPVPIFGPLPGLAFDPHRNRVLMTERSNAFDWDGQSWRQLPTVPWAAEPTRNPAVVFDPGTQRMLYLHDELPAAFSWDGANWAALPIAEPGPAGTLLQPDFHAERPFSHLHRYGILPLGTWRGHDAYLTTSPPVVEPIGFGCGRDGSPGLLAEGPPRLGDPHFTVRAELGNPHGLGLLAIGFAGPAQPLGGGCALWVGQVVVAPFGIADAAGRWRHPLPIPADPSLAGLALLTQAATFDPARGLYAGWSVSAALRLLIGD